jgi:hypothetical protein
MELVERVDPQLFDAVQEAFRLYWSGHFGPIVDETPQPKPRKAAARQRRGIGHSSARGNTRQPAAQNPPHQNPVLPRLHSSASDAANASDAPISATESNFSSHSQTPTTLSDGDHPYYFPTGYHQLPYAPHMNAAVSDFQGVLFPQSIPGYPFPTSMSGNSGSVAYPGGNHGVNETVPYPGTSASGSFHHPHQAFQSDEVQQADTSHLNQGYFLPPTCRATSHSMPPRPRHQPTGWQPVAGTSRSGAYPPHQPGT